MPNDIWDNLKAAIENEIPKDPEAVEEVYQDSAGFYAWLFDPIDDRTPWAEAPDKIPNKLADAVRPTVEDNLKAMLEVGELPAETDLDTLVNPTTYKLVGYILAWDKWLPDRRDREARDSFESIAGLTNEIYIEDDYGDITNIPDNSFMDDFEDYPIEEEGLVASAEEFHGHHDQRSHGHRGASPYDNKPDDPGAEKKLLEVAKTATQRHSLSGGRSGASVELVKGPHGRAVIKGGLDPDVVDREYLAAKVGKALGAPVPRIAKIDKNTIVGEYAHGKISGTFARDIGRLLPLSKDAERATVGLKGGRELAMMDIAIRNHDRHGGNIMVRPDGKSIIGIDHTVSFGAKAFLHKILPPSASLQTRWKHSFKKSDYQEAAKKLRPLQNDFLRAGHLDWHTAMMARLEERS